MKYCEKCRVNVAGDREECPLCQSPINGESTDEVFPYVPERYKKLSLFFKIVILALIVGMVVSVIINIAIPGHGWWSLFVVAGAFCGSISFITVIKKRKNILKNLMYQTVLLSVFAALWDYFTGWHMWSVNIVIPVLFILVIVSMYVLSKILKINAEEHMVYLLVLMLFGIIPIIFLVTDILWTPIPSAICAGFSIISFFTLLLFEGEKMWQEFSKRLHV